MIYRFEYRTKDGTVGSDFYLFARSNEEAMELARSNSIMLQRHNDNKTIEYKMDGTEEWVEATGEEIPLETFDVKRGEEMIVLTNEQFNHILDGGSVDVSDATIETV